MSKRKRQLLYKPEHQLLLLCSRRHLESDGQEQVRSLLKGGVDWDALLSAADRHGLYPLLYMNLDSMACLNVPASVSKKLKKQYLSNAGRNIRMLSALQEILSVLRQNDIEVVSFKGPVLSAFAFGDITCRVFHDLDVLISPIDVKRALSILATHGYRPVFRPDPNHFRVFIESESYFVLHDGRRNILCDLHWELSGRYALEAIYLGELRNHLSSVTLQKEEYSIFSKEALIPYLCLHASSHRWQKLEWIVCITELIDSGNNIDWGAVFETAEKWRCRRSVLLGLTLSKRLFDISTTRLPIDLMKKDDGIDKLASDSIDRLFGRPRETQHAGVEGRFSPFHIKIRDSFADCIRYSYRLVSLPTVNDFHDGELHGIGPCFARGFRPARLFAGLVRSMLPPLRRTL